MHTVRLRLQFISHKMMDLIQFSVADRTCEIFSGYPERGGRQILRRFKNLLFRETFFQKLHENKRNFSPHPPFCIHKCICIVCTYNVLTVNKKNIAVAIIPCEHLLPGLHLFSHFFPSVLIRTIIRRVLQ